MALTDTPLSELPGGGTYLQFQHESQDDLVAEGAVCEKSVFAYLGLKEAKFTGGSFKYCHFDHCYLRHATLERVDFTGSEFIRCNLKHATFTGCTLWYVAFRECELDYESLLQIASAEKLYIRKLLIHSLRMNAEAMGQREEANRLLLAEMKADRLHQFNIFVPKDRFYETHFSMGERLSAPFRWLGHWIARLVWGYGVEIRSIVASALILVFLVAFIFRLTAAPFFHPDRLSPDKMEPLNFVESLYVSAVTFSTLGYGDFTPATTFGRTVATCLGLVGAIYLGLIAATAYKRIQR